MTQENAPFFPGGYNILERVSWELLKCKTLSRQIQFPKFKPLEAHLLRVENMLKKTISP